MRTQRVLMTAAIAGVLLLPIAAQDLEVALQRTIQQETVNGDLKAAIQEYRKIVAKAGGNRAVAAKALVHMADCYQKIGDTEARKIYEQVVRDYADQKEAVLLARAGLGGSGQQRQTSTLVWVSSKSADDPAVGRISPDGRYCSFVDWETGDLKIHDFATGKDRNLTNQNAGNHYRDFAEESAISKDGRRIAYSWGSDKDNRAELRVANLTGEFAPRTLYSNPEAIWIYMLDWSPDDKLLAVDVTRRDHTNQLGVISVSDGSLRVLKSMDWRGTRRAFFSPDGKHLGYDLPEGDARQQQDVFVMSVDGSEEIRAVGGPVNDLMMGWSKDGKWLLFASDRTGSMSLWGLPCADGRQQGPQRLLRSDFAAEAAPMGVSRSGALYYFRGPMDGNRSRLFTVSFDFATGRFLSAPSEVTQDYDESDRAPAWLPDGARLSYSVRRGLARELLLAIRSMETGEVREIRPKLTWFDDGKWSHDGRWFLTRGQDLKGRWGIFQIDGRTGDATPLVLDQEGETNLYPVWAPDGKSFFFPREYRATKERAAIQKDLATGKERVLIRGQYTQGVNVSPDGRYMVSPSGDPATNTRTLLLVSLAGGARRELMRMPMEAAPDQRSPMGGGTGFSNVTWAPDSQSFLVWKKSQGPTRSELWQVFIDGSQPRRIEAPAIAVASNGPFVIHPDGKRLAFVYNERTPKENGEIWAIEHFLPESEAK